MSAETGVGPFHGVGQPHVERKLRRLAACSHEEKQRGRGNVGIADSEMTVPSQGRHIREAKRAEDPGDEEHSQQKSGVADAVDDECLVARVGRRLAVEIKTDQKVRAQAHAFPADKHERIVVGENQRQHGEHEEVEISEEAVVAAFVRHVSRGVNVDQHAHAGNKQQPDAGKRIEQEAGVRLERRRLAVLHDVVHVAGIGAEPRVQNRLIRLVEMFWRGRPC